MQVIWVYVTVITSRRPTGTPLLLLYCAAWFLLGFMAAHRLGHSSHAYYQ